MARIADTEIDRLKADVSLVRLIEGAGYTLVKQGKDVAMHCVLHEGDETPSFIVSPAKNVWHCFGCDRGGTVIDWVMATCWRSRWIDQFFPFSTDQQVRG